MLGNEQALSSPTGKEQLAKTGAYAHLNPDVWAALCHNSIRRW